MSVCSRLINLTGRRCACGAVAEPGAGICQKCRRRAQWLRRKRRHPDNDSRPYRMPVAHGS